MCVCVCVCVCVGETARGCGDWMQVCLGDGRRVAVFHNFPTFPPFHFCYGCFNWKMFHCFCTGNWGQVQTGGGELVRRADCRVYPAAVLAKGGCQGRLLGVPLSSVPSHCRFALGAVPGRTSRVVAKGGRQGYHGVRCLDARVPPRELVPFVVGEQFHDGVDVHAPQLHSVEQCDSLVFGGVCQVGSSKGWCDTLGAQQGALGQFR